MVDFNVVVFKIIFRRGGEPARIFVSQFKEAMKEEWIDKERLKEMNLDPLETELLETTKISYMVGKNTNLVPVIFPKDTLPALEILASSKYRMDAGVLKNNPYLFPSTRSSEFHLSGWHCYDETCQKASLENRINMTFTKNRHYVSTMYACMELPAHERDKFYDHMGHSMDMNKQRYQCPPAISEITKVGKFLHKIDQKGI